MPRKSSIDTLDEDIRSRIDALLKDGRLTLDEMLAQIRTAFPDAEVPSRSALGRYSQKFEDIGKRLRESREVAKVWADRLGKEPQGDIGKLVMELLRTAAFDATLELTEPDEEGKVMFDPKAINTLALAMARLESAGKWNLDREKAMRAALVSEVETKLASAPRKLDAEALRLVTVPKGIDPGWDYAPGASQARVVRQTIEQSRSKLPSQLGIDLKNSLDNLPTAPPAPLPPVPRRASPIAALTPEALKAARDYVSKAIAAPSLKQPPLPLAPVSPAATSQLRQLGATDGERELALDHDGVIHTLKKHGTPSERLRGQEPITAADLALFAALFNSGTLRAGNPPKAKDGSLLVVTEVDFGGFIYHLVARVRRRTVVPQTLYKRKK